MISIKKPLTHAPELLLLLLPLLLTNHHLVVDGTMEEGTAGHSEKGIVPVEATVRRSEIESDNEESPRQISMDGQQLTSDQLDYVSRNMPAERQEKLLGKAGRLSGRLSFNKSKAGSNWNRLNSRMLSFARQEKKQQEFVDHVADQYGIPEPISRIVKKDRKGRLFSEDKSLQAVLDFAYARWGESAEKGRGEEIEMKKMMGMEEDGKEGGKRKKRDIGGHDWHTELAQLELPASGCFVSFSVGEDINSKAFLFDLGTSVSEEDIEELEIVEERETGRKWIRQKIGEESVRWKKGHLMEEPGKALRRKSIKKKSLEEETKEEEKKEEEKKEGKEEKMKGKMEEAKEEIMEEHEDGEDVGKAEAKREGKEEEEEGKEEEEEEEDEPPIRLGTYAILQALQKGRKGLGPTPLLNWSRLPNDETIKNPRLKAAVLQFFQNIIDACDGNMDENNDENQLGEEEVSEVKLADFFKRVVEKEGKMDSEEDLAVYNAEIGQMNQKVLRSVRVASDEERAEIRELAVQRKTELEQTAVDPVQRAKIMAKKVDAYDFMRTVHFTIDGRPAFKEFKKLSEEHYQELVRLADPKHPSEFKLQGELSTLHRAIADTIISTKRAWYVKTGKFLFNAGKYLGKKLGKAVIWLGRKMKLLQPKDDSREKMKKKQKQEKKLAKLDQKRRQTLMEAIELIRQNSQCKRLKAPLEWAIYGEDGKLAKQPALRDLQARLGAQALNSVLNTKRFPEGHWLAVFMSVFGSGLIGISLDVAAIPGIMSLFSWIIGFTVFPPMPFIGVVLIFVYEIIFKPLMEIGMESSTPLVAETFDSAIIKQYLDSLKGKKFWRGMKQFRNTLVEAVESGKIAAIGSILFNISMQFSHPYLLPVQFVFNILATMTSAAMVPIELKKTRDATMLSIYKKQAEGFFPEATPEFKKQLGEEMQKAVEKSGKKLWVKLWRKKNKTMEVRPDEWRNTAYINWIERETWRTMEVEQSSRLAINSLGIGPIISSIVFTAMQQIGHYVPGVPEAMVNAVTVMVNSPTEMISLTGAILGANKLGLEKYPWLLSKDEQKNAQIIGLVFSRALEQYRLQLEGGGSEPVEISAKELHRVYNPYINTMVLGRLVTKGGIWVKEKWDRFSARKQYRMKPISELGMANVNGPLVQHWKHGLVYLITLPRTSAAQNLSPKALALELWLKSQKIAFYRISDGLFIRSLISEDEFPYVELNGQKIKGSLRQIVNALRAESPGTPGEQMTKEIVLQSFEEHVLVPLQTVLNTDRRLEHGLDFLINDRGLIIELISTMSQLYPKLVDFELEFVDTWDSLPWQLKRIFELVRQEKKDVPSTKLADQQHNNMQQLLKELATDRKAIEKLFNFVTINLTKSGAFVHGREFTVSDAALFGLLVQFFETPLHNPQLKQYFDGMKSNGDNNVVWKYYQRLIDDYLDGPKWTALKAEPWALNYEFQANTDDSGKYDGQFKFDLQDKLTTIITREMNTNGKKQKPAAEAIPLSPEQEKQLRMFTAISQLGDEPEPVVAELEAEMHREKVPHAWFGSLMKVRKRWTDEEFARVLDERLEQRKREMYREELGLKVLNHYPPVLTVITERLLDIVWDWSMLEERDTVDEMEKSEQQLAAGIGEIVAEYMEQRAIRLVDSEADNDAFRAFAYYNKASELFEQRTKQRLLTVIDHFYEEQLLNQVHFCLCENNVSKSVADQVLNKLGDQQLQLTVNAVLVRVNDVFNNEVTKELKKALNVILVNTPQSLLLSEDVRQLHCVQTLMKRQAEAIEYVTKNAGRIGKDESRKAIVARLARVFKRFIGLKKQLLDECSGYSKQLKREIAKLEKSQTSLDKGREKIGKEVLKLAGSLESISAGNKHLTSLGLTHSQAEQHLTVAQRSIGRIDDDQLHAAIVADKKAKKEELERWQKHKDKLISGIAEPTNALSAGLDAMVKAVKEVEKSRKKVLKKMKVIWQLNDKMRDLVKLWVEGIDPKGKRVEMGELLAENVRRLARFHHSIGQNTGNGHHVLGASTDQNIRQLLALHAEAIAHLNVLEHEGTTLKKLEEAREIFNQIHVHFHGNGPVNKDLQKVGEGIDTALNVLTARARFYAFSTKKIVADTLETIDEQIIRQQVKLDRKFLKVMKWEKEMPQEYVPRMKAALGELVARIRANTVNVNNDEEEDAKMEGEINAKIREFLAEEQTQKQAFLSTWMAQEDMDGFLLQNGDQICEAEMLELVLGKERFRALEANARYMEICADRTTKLLTALGKAKQQKAEEQASTSEVQGQPLIVQQQIEQFHQEQRSKRTTEKLRKAKYPIAKAVLHLAASYLCENDGKNDNVESEQTADDVCGHEHKNLAAKELQKLAVAEGDVLKLLNNVRKVVFHAIADFNENFMIREAILNRYGLPLQKELNKAEKAILKKRGILAEEQAGDEEEFEQQKQ